VHAKFGEISEREVTQLKCHMRNRKGTVFRHERFDASSLNH